MAKHPVTESQKTNLASISSSLQVPAVLARRPLRRFVLVGGIARSGTTLVGNLLHAQPDVFCFEEFMMFKSRQHVATLDSLRSGGLAERNLWTDAAGLNWRGIARDDEHQRLLFEVMALLAAGTPDNALRGKQMQDITIIACKTPSSEFTALEFAKLLEPLPVVYVHCVREPWALAQSTWEMPWMRDTDGKPFLRGLINHMAESLRAYRAIVASGTAHVVVKAEDLWNADTSQVTWRRVLDGVGSPAQEGAAAVSQADHWPKQKRRKVAPLSESLRNWFLQEPEVDVWCREFGYR